jgi:type IV pilus assembly protein PilM
MAPGNKKTARPMLACEISSDRVIAARANDGGQFVEIHTSRALPPGLMTPSLTEKNIGDPNVLSAVLADALGALSGRFRDVIAVLPDPAVRVVLLDFDSLPQVKEEAIGVIRFRLRKSLPFDVEKAAVSYHAYQAAEGLKVVAAVALASVIEEYESAFVRAGYAPGIVLPSTLASLGIVDAGRPTLVIKTSESMTTLAIVDAQALRLFRSLDHAISGAMDAGRLVEDIHPSMIFFQDNFGSDVERVLVGGSASASEIASVLESSLSAPVEELLPSHYVSSGLSGGSSAASLAAVAGALLG